ncbi:hypothetical protein, partial [Streptomyces sp. V2]|uniref:hypothetical protein n=1 Tax=Streptomyces sp. V2 TaxID=1424099 RepID=UPI0019D0FF5A
REEQELDEGMRSEEDERREEGGVGESKARGIRGERGRRQEGREEGVGEEEEGMGEEDVFCRCV